MFIPDPNFFNPGSASKNLRILTPKNGFQALGNMNRVVHSGSGSATLLLTSHHEVKKIKDEKRLRHLLWVNIIQRLYSKNNVGYGTVWNVCWS
jgi:hypothetical protein